MGFDFDKWRSEHVIEEGDGSGTVNGHPVLTERGAIGEAAGDGTRPITVITEGWGSSGYYSREVLGRDGPRIFPPGTHMYVNHPTTREEQERPERDVRHLMGVTEGKLFMAGGELKGKAEVFSHWRPFVNEVGPHIGLSIRAAGDLTEGEVGGRKGPIVHALTEGLSIDYVTKAGRGGKIGESARRLFESAQEASLRTCPGCGKQQAAYKDTCDSCGDAMTVASPSETGILVPADLPEAAQARNVADWLASKVHAEFSRVADDHFGQGYITRDDRKALSSAIGSGLDAFNSTVADEAPHLSSQDPYLSPMPATEVLREVDEAVLLGEPYGIRPPNDSGEYCVYNTDTGSDVPGGCHEARADALKHQRALAVNVQASRRSSGGGKEPSDMGDKEQLTELQESVQRLEKKDEEREQKLKEAETRAERAEDALLQNSAEKIVSEFIEEHKEGDDPLPELPDRAVKRVREAALDGKLPLDEDGKLVKERLHERVRKAAKEEKEYLSGASGNGQVRGVGGSPVEEGAGNGNDDEVSEKDEKELSESFGRLGMSEKAAQRAAKGR